MAKKPQKKNKSEGLIPSEMSVEDVMTPANPDKELADKLVSIAQKQIETSNRFKRDRMADVQKSMDLNDGKTKKAMKGRWNVPLPIMSGFSDTLLSKIDDAPRVKFGYTDVADMQRSQKVQAKWEEDSGDEQEQWAAKDRMEKKIAIFYGVGIKKYFAYNDVEGNYRTHLEVVDPLDFECEPMGGQFLRDHKFMGQRNIFKMMSELEAGTQGAKPVYDVDQVNILKTRLTPEEFKKFNKIYIEKTDRMRSLGFNTELNDYVGTSIVNMTEWYMLYEGVWYYLLMEPHSGTWVRFKRLKDIFESGVPPYVAWHTHPDPFVFWSKAPADDMRPVAEAMNIAFNQMLDAREKNIYRQRAYDPEMLTDPSQLEWRPDGLVEVNTMGGEKPISNSIYEFRVEGVSETGTINLMSFVDSFVGGKLGVTPAAEGESQDKLVGIYYGNLQQVADRLGLYNKSYSEAWGRLGWLYYWGLREHIKENKLMVRMIGDKGYNWVQLVADDTDPEHPFNITITGGQAEMASDALKSKKKMDGLSLIVGNSLLVQQLNPRAVSEEVLKLSEFGDDQVRKLLDKQSDGSEELISEAHQAIQLILAGGKPKINRGATELFINTIVEFAQDSEDLDDTEFATLMSYAESHVKVASENMVRREMLAGSIMAAKIAMSQPPTGGGGGAKDLNAKDANAVAPGPGGSGTPPGSPTPDNLTYAAESLPGKSGTAARSMVASNTMTP